MGDRSTWRLLRDGVVDPFEHFAVEEAIVRGVDEGTSPETLRLRQVEPSVLIGIYQEPDDEVDLAYCQERGIKVVRRHNPGGSVYQDQGSFCFSATFRHHQFARWGLPDSAGLYGLVGRAIEAACARFGASARARPVNDVEIGGRKVYGSAQLEWYNAFVHSGTFLVSTNIDEMARALRPSPLKFADKPCVGVRGRVVTLSEAVGHELRVDDVMHAVATELGAALQVELVAGELTEQERTVACALLESKYGRREWTFRGKRCCSTVLSAKARSGVVTLEASVRGDSFESVAIRGDFLIANQRQLEDLERRFRAIPLQEGPTIAARSDLPHDLRDALCALLRELYESLCKEAG